ncbi:hypothetical protein [Aquibium oceanicum]
MRLVWYLLAALFTGHAVAMIVLGPPKGPLYAYFFGEEQAAVELRGGD